MLFRTWILSRSCCLCRNFFRWNYNLHFKNSYWRSGSNSPRYSLYDNCFRSTSSEVITLSASFKRFEGRRDGAIHFVTICGNLRSLFLASFRPFRIYVSDKMGHSSPQRVYLRHLPPFVGKDSEETSTERWQGKSCTRWKSLWIYFFCLLSQYSLAGALRLM